MQTLDLYYFVACNFNMSQYVHTHAQETWMSEGVVSNQYKSSSSASSGSTLSYPVINVKLRGVLEHPEPLAGYATGLYGLFTGCI